MQVFPGRTLEELDCIDEARVYRALEAREIDRQCRVIREWFRGNATLRQLRFVDPTLRREYMEIRKRD